MKNTLRHLIHRYMMATSEEYRYNYNKRQRWTSLMRATNAIREGLRQ